METGAVETGGGGDWKVMHKLVSLKLLAWWSGSDGTDEGLYKFLKF